MNTVEALRTFKTLINERIERKTGWGKIEINKEIEGAYQEILELLVAAKPYNEGQER